MRLWCFYAHRWMPRAVFAAWLLLSSAQGQSAPGGGVKIASPLDGAILQGDEVMVMVDTSGLGSTVLSRDMLLCVTLGDDRRCYQGYELGNAEDQVFVKYFPLPKVEEAKEWKLGAFAAALAPAENGTDSTATDEVYYMPATEESVVTFRQAPGQACSAPAEPRKVFDAFMFLNELDLLELRLRELGDVVDHFVLIEANATHTLKPKPFVFDLNQARFERWLPKIIHLAVESDYLEQRRGHSAWDTETLQRNALFHAVAGFGAQPHDVVLVSDVDEVPRREVVRRLRDCREAMPGAVKLHMDWYVYNGYWRHRDEQWGLTAREGPIAIEAGQLNELVRTPTRARRQLRTGNLRVFMDLTWTVLHAAGWHFSSFGGPEAVREKLVSYADEPFALSLFLLEPRRMERLQYFGAPYYWLRTLRSIDDNPFTRVPAHDDSLPRQALEQDPGSPASERLQRLFFPPSSSDPLVTDPVWLAQDLKAARLYMDTFDTNVRPSTVKERNMVPFDFDCDRYEEQVSEFCQDRGPFCAAELPGHAARACTEAAGRSARLFVEMTDEPDLLPLRGHEAGGTGQPIEFIVEWSEGSSDAGRVVAQACSEYLWGRSPEQCRDYVQGLLDSTLRQRTQQQQQHTGSSPPPPAEPPKPRTAAPGGQEAPAWQGGRESAGWLWGGAGSTGR